MDDFGMGYALGSESDGNRNNGFFGGEGIWAILLFAMIFGWGNGGWGGFGGGGINSPAGQGALTRSDLCSEFALNDLQNGVRGIQQGICDSTFALNNTMTNGFHGVDTAVCNLGYNVQNGFNQIGHQISDCCCQTQNAIQNVRYDMATQACDTRNLIQSTTRDITDNANANTRAILDFLTQDKISTLQAENQSLKLAASQAAQNAYLVANNDAQTAELIRRIAPPPVPSYTVPAPYPYCGTGYSNGCGC